MIRKFAIIFVTIVFFGCQKAEESKNETDLPNPAKTIESRKIEKPKVNLPVDIVKLVDKSANEVEKILGNPEEVKPTDDGGDYRLYKVADEPKGLAIRFYGGKAKSFNLILSKPLASSKEALKEVFAVDVGNVVPVKDVKEPLSEKYQRTFGGIKFSKVSAKKDEKGSGFIFVLVEISR